MLWLLVRNHFGKDIPEDIHNMCFLFKYNILESLIISVSFKLI